VETIRDAVPDVTAIYQFGSTVAHTEHAGSDIDLAYLADAELDNTSRWTLQERIAARLRRDVDLVDVRRASTVMRVQVISNGVVLYESDTTARQRFEMTTYSAYALLNEERRHILRDIRERGTIYG